MLFGKPLTGESPTGTTPAWWRSPWLWGLLVLYVLALFLDCRHEPVYCDEGSFLKNVCHFFVHRTAEPVYTNYPTFYSYLLAVPVYAVYFIYYVLVRRFPWEGLTDARLFALVFQSDLDIWMWAGRAMSILFAAGILVLVWRYCASRLTRPAAWVAVCLLLASPYEFYMMHARYALPDIVVAFLATAVLVIACRYLEKPDDRRLYLAGFLAGIAASAKLNGALAVTPLLFVPWSVPGPVKHKWRLTFAAAVCALAGFALGSPFNILKPQLYQGGFGLESGLLFSGPSDLLPLWLVPELWKASPGMTALVIVAVVFSLWRHSPRDMLFHSLLITSLVVLGGLTKRVPHYFMFLFPWACIMIGEAFQAAWQLKRARVLRWLLIAAATGVVGYECHLATARVVRNSRPNNVRTAQEWIGHNIPAGGVLVDGLNIPIGFLDLGVMPREEYIDKNKYQPIVAEYARGRMSGQVSYLIAYDVTARELAGEGWKYLVTADTTFKPYLQDPSGVDWVQHGGRQAFIEYLQRRIFYLRLFREPARVKVFRDGSGPEVYIFRLM